MTKTLQYFNGNELAADVFLNKYALKNTKQFLIESTPDEMHTRMAKEFARIESYKTNDRDSLSDFGKSLPDFLDETFIFQYFDKFKYIIPQGSIMAILGNPYQIGSLSNCVVIPPPHDSYGGICKTDERLVQLMKRRCGVGTHISTLRPSNSTVSNAAGTSTGATSFMHRFSNTTREVAQSGRRGALMLLLDCRHPEIFDFCKIKSDLTKVTGANISAMLTDKFMDAALKDEDFLCTFPINATLPINYHLLNLEYNKIEEINSGDENFVKIHIIKIHAKELFDLIVEMAWTNAEPGIAFMDQVVGYSPDGVYDRFRPIASNPCFHPDTLIETVEGRIKIKDLNKSTKVYSMDENGALCIRTASASFISKKNAKTIKITLNSENSIQVTPNHKLYEQDKGWMEAKDFKIGDRIGHLCRSRRGISYSGVYLTTDKRGRDAQEMEHRLILDIKERNLDVHHLDRNTYNNKVDNLVAVSHRDHSVITATEDNPQTHQIRNEKGNFITHALSKKGRKVIIPMPDDIKTGMKNQWSNAICSIEEGETTDVYDIQVEETHCLIANNMVAHNCGEQWLQAFDACRLLAMNFYSFVTNPFTKSASIDFNKLYEVAYIQQRLADDIVDLEIEYIDKIIAKIKSDPEPDDIKATEVDLWIKLKEEASASRRTGCGFTGLGDMLAALGLKYDSDKALKIIDKVMYTKMQGELDCTIDLAITRGTFKGWDKNLEFSVDAKGNLVGNNGFYQMMLDKFPKQVDRMYKFGRRNVSWSTVAPTGSVSILTETTSGLEPLFLPYYMRRVKKNSNEKK